MRKENIYALYLYMIGGFGGAERRLLRAYNRISEEKKVDLVIRGMSKCDFAKCCKTGDIDTSNFRRIVCFQRDKASDFKCVCFLMKQRYAVVHFFDYSHVYLVLAFLSPMFGVRTLCTIADYEIVQSLKRKDDRKLYALLKRVSWVDLLYASGRRYVARVCRGKVSVTPGTFTDLEVFVPAEKKNIILFAAARLMKDKNPGLLIDACRLCKDGLSSYGYSVYILGKDYEEEAIKKNVEAYGLGDIVKMPGYQQSSDYFPAAKVFTSLQKYENYPSQSLAEAYASGCYVIATDVGETRRIVDKGCSALIGCNAKELSEAIMDYITMPDEKQKRLQAAAREYASEAFDIRRSVAYFNRLLEHLSASGDETAKAVF